MCHYVYLQTPTVSEQTSLKETDNLEVVMNSRKKSLSSSGAAALMSNLTAVVLLGHGRRKIPLAKKIRPMTTPEAIMKPLMSTLKRL